MTDSAEITGKDLATMVQHLRSINLSFVLAAVAIVIALSTSNTVYQAATQQLRDVVELSDLLNENAVAASVRRAGGMPEPPEDSFAPNAMEAFAAGALADYFESMQVTPDSFDIRYFAIDLPRDDFGHVGSLDDHLQYLERSSWFRNARALLSDGTAIYTNPLDLFSGPLRSVEDYRTRLNGLLAADRMYIQPEFQVAYIVRNTRIAARYPGLPESVLTSLRGMRDLQPWVTLTGITLTDARSRDVYATSQGHIQEDPVGYEDYDFRFDELSLRISAGDLRFDLVLPVMFAAMRPDFVETALASPRLDPAYHARYLSGAQTFGRLFPELTQVSGMLTSLSPDALATYLEDQKRKSGAPISVLGLQIGRDLIEIWGVLLMLSIQLYFCMHYRAFLTRLPHGAAIAFPWIGLYRDRLSASVFQVSLGFPLAATLYAGYRQWAVAATVGPAEILLIAAAFGLFVWAGLGYRAFRRQVYPAAGAPE